MSNTEDNTPIDNELKAYLAGEDGVSAAYKQIGEEEPPAELDRLILAAAHSAVMNSSVKNSVNGSANSSANSAVKQHTPRKMANLQQKFSIAASFMVGVLITSMYFNQADDMAENTGSSGAVRERLIIQSVEQPAPAAAPALLPAAPAVAVEQEVQPEPLERAAAQQAPLLAQQTARSEAEARQETPEPEVNKAESSEDSALADNATEARDTTADAGAAEQTQANTREIATAANIAPPAIPARVDQTRAESDTAGVQLEEIMVTGTRIRTVNELEFPYRESQQAWLERILALGEEIIFQTDALEENSSRLQEEMELFSETYPDVDLEAELETLLAE